MTPTAARAIAGSWESPTAQDRWAEADLAALRRAERGMDLAHRTLVSVVDRLATEPLVQWPAGSPRPGEALGGALGGALAEPDATGGPVATGGPGTSVRETPPVAGWRPVLQRWFMPDAGGVLILVGLLAIVLALVLV